MFGLGYISNLVSGKANKQAEREAEKQKAETAEERKREEIELEAKKKEFDVEAGADSRGEKENQAKVCMKRTFELNNGLEQESAR
jgi:hypothetical protein